MVSPWGPDLQSAGRKGGYALTCSVPRFLISSISCTGVGAVCSKFGRTSHCRIRGNAKQRAPGNPTWALPLLCPQPNLAARLAP